MDPYPQPRGDRRAAGGPVDAGGAIVPVPRSFVWSGHVRNAGADLVGTVVSRRITGPAFLDECNWLPQLGAGATRSPKFFLGYTVSPFTAGNDQAVATLANVTMLVEQSFTDDGGFATSTPDGLYHTNVTVVTRNVRLGRAIQAPEFFLVGGVRDDAGAGAFIVDFTLRVLENVDPDLLADLVAS